MENTIDGASGTLDLLDARLAWTVALGGGFWRATDGGASWRQISPGDTRMS